jgi:hypothetical protein
MDVKCSAAAGFGPQCLWLEPRCASRRGSLSVLLDNTHLNTHTLGVQFSFDPDKQARNLKKHGFDLSDARKVIESGKTVTFEDRRFD